MKKLVFFLVVIIVVAMSISLSSCNGKKSVEPAVEKTVETTVIETNPGSGGIIFAKEITVANGETVWGYSQEVYGNGSQWRDIVSENKFLQEPGRVYFDVNKKRWIAKIYPGEVVRIGGQVIAPTYIFSEKITTTTPVKSEKANLNWLWILLGVLGLIILVFIINLLSNNRVDNSNTNASGCHCGAGGNGCAGCAGGNCGAGGNANASVHINVQEGQNFDLATENGMMMARHNRVCQITESVSSQMISKQNISDADLWTNFSSNGEINFHIRANYREEKEETK